MIELSHISKIFNRGTATATNALQDINLTVYRGEFVVVVGANGSGKSTLLNLLAGAEIPDGGYIYIDGNNVTSLPDYRRSRWIARIFQNPLVGTSPELTVLENFRLACLRTQQKKLHIGTGNRFKEMAKEQLSLLNLGLEHKLNQPAGTLSGGQRQALTLLMAAAPFMLPVKGSNPSSITESSGLILLDEPTSALDPRTSQTIMQLADKLIKEYHLTALFVTHHIKDALHYGNRILLMKEGRIAKDLSGKAKQSLQQVDLYEWFE